MRCSTHTFQKGQLEKLKKKLQAHAESLGLSLQQKTPAIKARDKRVVCRTFHGVGIVVPVNEQGIGYREVPETTGREGCAIFIY